ncbi:MAG: S-formylglutathione hydrolase [Henriciella sp.]|uniref:S-formylglutathione hydrolase n=1 Tax=Henriciella sp. TaxID=1968823 RepID=UPI00261F92D4|nr:S-formylglutathione hydrolase [Henriciella sp.]
MQTVSEWTCFGGDLSVHDHDSETLDCSMRFAVFEPPQAAEEPVPVLWYLSGLTCTWANVMEKSGLQRKASELGVMIVAPDTSPRGDKVADDEAYDLGQGAGFYLTATEDPWAKHYKMDQYVMEELPSIIRSNFAADMRRQSIFGHSMGGHGALTLALKNPGHFRSVSAFAPIAAPSQVPWGEKAFKAYLGDDEAAWKAYDACELVKQQQLETTILIDQGEDDQFLEEQLKPRLFEEACREAGQPLAIRMRPGYDHSYYFISTFMDDHIMHHAKALYA